MQRKVTVYYYYYYCFNEMTDKVQRTSIYSFKVFLKQRVLDTYKSTCKIDKCKTCAIINM